MSTEELRLVQHVLSMYLQEKNAKGEHIEIEYKSLYFKITSDLCKTLTKG